MSSAADADVEQTDRLGTAPGFGEWFRGPWFIAVHTWREGIRKKTLVGFLILSLLTIFGASFMTTSLGAIDPTAQEDLSLKLIKDICVTTIDIFGVLITIFISASVVPTEVENKVIYTVLSKPIRRFQYLLGKFVGVQFIVIVNLVLMGGLFFMALYARERVWPTMLMWSIMLTYFQFLIISAFTFAISCAATSAVLPTIAGLFIYLIGNLTEYLKDVASRLEESTEMMGKLVYYTALALWNVLPNLQQFSIKNQILNAPIGDPPADVFPIRLIAYGLVYAASGMILAYWIFRRKEL
ncbi:MAG: ABC transporter permease subunit [Candidatus Hydrogenedentes bacterium]|nr:ABC transporter permease subunit [Candidatus Hydrogenedentota bacterium]